jgi:hypothetical protein
MWHKLKDKQPPLDIQIWTRTDNFLGFGRTYDTMCFCSEVMNQDDAENTLINLDMTEWMELPNE